MALHGPHLHQSVAENLKEHTGSLSNGKFPIKRNLNQKGVPRNSFNGPLVHVKLHASHDAMLLDDRYAQNGAAFPIRT